MGKPDAVFICIATYPSEAAARADYDVVKDLHAAGVVVHRRDTGRSPGPRPGSLGRSRSPRRNPLRCSPTAPATQPA